MRLNAVWSGWRTRDIAGILGVAVVLVGVHLLPAGLRMELMLSYDAPSLYQLFTAAYVHRGWEHLGSNVAMYLMFAGLGYTLCARAGRKRLFQRGFVYSILVVPVLVSGLNLWFLDVSSGAGFSGVAAAFLGMLPVFIAAMLAQRGVVDGYEVPLVLVMAGLAGIAYQLASIGWELLAPGLYTAFLLTVVIRENGGLDAIVDRLGQLSLFDKALLNLGAAFCIVLPYSLVEPGGSTHGVTNIFGHLVGYAVGFAGLYLWNMFSSWTAEPTELEPSKKSSWLPTSVSTHGRN